MQPFLALVGFFILYVAYECWSLRKLPPGPTRLPLIGNLHQAPKEQAWLTYLQWFKKYGSIFRVQFGKDILIMISDVNIARDLLDKRGNIYSDRPRMVMAGENVTKGMHLLLRPYNERYRMHQRMEATLLSPRASKSYEVLQDLESKQLLQKFLSGNNFHEYFELFAASLIYTLIYGHRVEDRNDQALVDAHEVQQNFTFVASTGRWLVDALPIINYLPKFVAPWKETAERLFKIESDMHLRNLHCGLESKCWNWAKELTKSKEGQSMPRLEMAYDAGVLSDAALDTTAITLDIFVMATLSYPDFMSKAQKEIDAVVGRNRLPDLNDKSSLPYTDAVITETMRWRPILPMGFPHAAMKEDYYNGFRIPKGAVVIASHWAIDHNEEVFDEPRAFRPERWLENPNAGANFFGFGRRMCTGRHIARNSLFLVISRLLWAFDIRCPKDANGRPVKPDDMAFTAGFSIRPKPFSAVFEPRDEDTQSLIGKLWDETDKDVGSILDSIRDQQVAAGLVRNA